jgi:hypothetical protein
MTLSDWIISTSAALVTILISLVAYFAHKWVDTLDTTVKENTTDVKKLGTHVLKLEQAHETHVKNIAHNLALHAGQVRIPHDKIDKMGREITEVKTVVHEQLLPNSEKINQHYGKIILLESQIQEQNSKILKLFTVLKSLHEIQKKMGPR